MGNKSSKNSQGQNLLQSIKEADQADNLFIGGHRNLLHWSASHEKKTEDYGQIMAANISAMVKTSGKKYLFVADLIGC
jgi:WD40 repeat protein